MATERLTVFNAFDSAIINALKRQPQGLRYNDLYRQSGGEYARAVKRFGVLGERQENGINIKTFDKHLKGLVAERVLERIEEKRSRVFYRLLIPENSFPKKYVADAQLWVDRVFGRYVKVIGEAYELIDVDDDSVTFQLDIATHWARDSLVEAIKLYRENPAYSRYLIDEAAELTRRQCYEVAKILGGNVVRQKVIPVLNKLEARTSILQRARGQKLFRNIPALRGEKTQPTSNSDFTIDLSKMKGDGDFDCPRCKTHISPDDETEKSYKIIAEEIGANRRLMAMAIKCQRCGAITRLEGFE